MIGRRYSDGLHQAIEAKENVHVQRESQTLATITFQNYFRMYQKLAGMTGTAVTEESEFIKIYNLPVVQIPTAKPMIREDLPDAVYKTERAKFQAVVDEICERHATGQPLLVGTVSIEKSELLSDMLSKRGVPPSGAQREESRKGSRDHKTCRATWRSYYCNKYGGTRNGYCTGTGRPRAWRTSCNRH